MDFSAQTSSFSSFSSRVFGVVMAGGAGTRLWPTSRAARPKPFLPLAPNGGSLLRATLDRLDGLVPTEDRFIVAGRAFGSLVFDFAPELAPERVLLEPIGRDTTACVAWAALETLKLDPDATNIVLPSDHWIEPNESFRAVLARAVQLVDADPDRLVALGVKPTEPSSAYGYIEVGSPLEESARDAFAVDRFCEKPDEETAKRFLETGRFLWNAGVFIWKARRILELIERYEPEIGEQLRRLDVAIEAARRQNVRADETRDFEDVFSRVKRVAIDRAVLERASNVVVLAADSFHWNDLGSFSALETLATRQDSSRVVGARLIEENASRNYVRVESSGPRSRERLVALVNVDDLLVVDSEDALLIARKGSDGALKKIVARLKEKGAEEYL